MQLGATTIPLLPAVAVGVAVILAVLVLWGVRRVRRDPVPAALPALRAEVPDPGPCAEDWTGELAGGVADPPQPVRRATVADAVAARLADTAPFPAVTPSSGLHRAAEEDEPDAPGVPAADPGPDPEPAAASGPAPEGLVPSSSVPSSSVPSSSVPDGSVPSSLVPGSSVPDAPVSNAPVSDAPASGSSAPGGAVPVDPAPEDVPPEAPEAPNTPATPEAANRLPDSLGPAPWSTPTLPPGLPEGVVPELAEDADTVESVAPGPVPPPWSADRAGPGGSAEPLPLAVRQALAARAVQRARRDELEPEPPADVPDARDRLLSVLLTDPAAALGATTELDDTRARIERLGDVLRRRRTDLATAVHRLHDSGLTGEQIGRLAGLDDADVRAILEGSR